MRKLIPIKAGLHECQATALLQEGYPWGFKLKCKRKVWLEYKEGYGFRFCSQTEDPRNGRWCKPKCGTYSELALLAKIEDPGGDEDGHVTWVGVDLYDLNKIDAFEAEYGHVFGEREKAIIAAMRRAIKRQTRRWQYQHALMFFMGKHYFRTTPGVYFTGNIYVPTSDKHGINACGPTREERFRYLNEEIKEDEVTSRALDHWYSSADQNKLTAGDEAAARDLLVAMFQDSELAKEIKVLKACA